jgi:hypothetical protein
MSFGNTTETDLLNKLFKNTALPFDAITDLYLALHTADPGEAGSQTTSEATYTSYARVAVERSATGWTVSNPTATNAALVQFPTCTGGSNTISYVSIGTASSGAGQILVSGALNSSLTVSSGIQPQFSAGALVFTLD